MGYQVLQIGLFRGEHRRLAAWEEISRDAHRSCRGLAVRWRLVRLRLGWAEITHLLFPIKTVHRLCAMQGFVLVLEDGVQFGSFSRLKIF